MALICIGSRYAIRVGEGVEFGEQFEPGYSVFFLGLGGKMCGLSTRLAGFTGRWCSREGFRKAGVEVLIKIDNII